MKKIFIFLHKALSSITRSKNILLFCVLICLIAIFWSPINTVLVDVLVTPIFQNITENSWGIMVAMIVIEISYYIMIYKQLLYEKRHSIRRILTIEVIIVYLIFRFSGEYRFYGIRESFPAYLDIICILTVIAEVLFCCFNYIKEKKSKSSIPESNAPTFFMDSPTHSDDLKRNEYAHALVDRIVFTFSKRPMEEMTTSLSVLLSERFGQGKSSFLEQIKDICKNQKIETIVFRPWLSNNPDHLTLNYFNLLKEQLGTNNKELKKLLDSYAILASEHITGKIAKVSNSLLNNSSIEVQHDDIARIMQREGKLRIVLIDDVDRLQPEELLSLIKLIRNTADFPYIAYVVAADKYALKDTLQVSAGITDPEKYLKKFFNFELLFPADDDNIIDSLKKNISAILRGFGYMENDIKKLSADIDNNAEYYAPVFANMRDVYRFCNVLSFALDITKKHSDGISLLNDIYINDFVKICMIQYISPELYKMLRDYSSSVLKYAGNGRLTLGDGIKKFVADRENVRRARAMAQQIVRLKNTYSEKETDKNGNQNNEAEAPTKAVEDIMNKIAPSGIELLKNILAELWEDSINYAHPKSICYTSQYFLYFSGRYKRCEMSDIEVAELFGKAGDDFSNSARSLIETKRESMLHKLKILLSYEKIDRLHLLNNIQSLAYIDYLHYCEENGFVYSGFYDFYCNREYGSIVRQLYRLRNNDDTDILYKEHLGYFNSTNEFAFAALSIKYIKRPEHSNIENVFSAEQLEEFAKQTIDNFYNRLFVKNPFAAKTIEAIPCMRSINLKYWNYLFEEYVKKSEKPMEWLFRLFITDKNGGMYWNRSMLMAIIGEKQEIHSLSLYNLVCSICNDETFKKYEGYLSKFETKDYFESISNEMIDGNLFLKDAYEWLKEKHINP